MLDRKKKGEREVVVVVVVWGDSALLHISSNLTSKQPLSLSEIWRDTDLIIFF